MAPSVSAFLLALLPIISGLPNPSPAPVDIPIADSAGKIEGSWIVVWKQEADANTIAARQAEFATTLRKRNLAKRDGDNSSMPMDSTNFAIRDFRATVCNTDAETMKVMVSSAADQVDWVEANPKAFAFQAGGKKPEPPPPDFDLDESVRKSQEVGGPQGEGTSLYIMDTGINPKHEVFGGRAKTLANMVPGEADEDLNGHGTHTAGSAAGLGTGPATKADIKAVKILNAQGAGSGDSIIGGFDAACKDVEENKLEGKCVVSMSLGTEFSKAVNAAATKMGKCGCAMVVAAGNEDRNASVVSPASADDVITVGATDVRTGKLAGFSNKGKDVDISANGVNVISADFKNNTGFKDLTGTSMSCPQVAGEALVKLSEGNLACTTDCTVKVLDALKKDAKKERRIIEDPKALDTPALQLNTSAQVPVDLEGPTPEGAGAKKNGASQGVDVGEGEGAGGKGGKGGKGRQG